MGEREVLFLYRGKVKLCRIFQYFYQLINEYLLNENVGKYVMYQLYIKNIDSVGFKLFLVLLGNR